MKFFGVRDFQESGIPNLLPGYSIVTKEDWKTLKYGEDPLLTVYHGNMYSCDVPKCYSLGLCSETGLSASRAGLQALDTLYYLSNPPRYLSKKHGGPLKAFWDALRQRSNDSMFVRQSPQTRAMLNFALEYLDRNVPGTDMDKLEWVNRRCSDTFHVCFLQEKLFPLIDLDQFYLQSRTDNVMVWALVEKGLTSNCSPESFGYVLDEGSGAWVKPGYCIIDGELYNENDVRFEECIVCGNEVLSTQLDENEVCRDCRENKYKIHSYSTRAERMLKFKAKHVDPDKRLIYYGLELEYESSNRESDRVSVGKLLEGHAIMKSDGSINDGFEIVTCPATPEIHLEVFRNFFDHFNDMSLHSERNVGMHIHVSRKPLGMFAVGKMTEFLNKQENKDFITSLAGRTLNNYCSQETSRTVTFPLVQGSGARYNTLNLNNENTVEVRIFSTPTSYDEFARKLQFVQALTTFSQPCQVDAPLKELTHFGTFLKWLKGNRKFYPELAAFLKSSM